VEGREQERRAVRTLLDGARAGRAGVLGLRGAAGTGKTTLCDDAVAAATDMTVLSLSGAESERDLPLAALLALLRPLGELVDDLPDAQRTVAAALLEGVGSRAVADSFALGATCLALLAAAAEEEPLLVVVDDVQWIDEVSGHAMAFALRRLGRDAVAVVLASREADPDDERPYPLSGSWPWIDLGGLDEDHSVRLLAGSGVAPAVAARLCVACAGNPLALLELARGLSAPQRAGVAPLPDPVPLGPRGTAVLGGRLVGLPTETQQALAALAAAGESELAHLPRVLLALGLDAGALVAAERAGVVRVDAGVPRFVHPLLRAAATARAGPDALRRAHAAWAALGGLSTVRRAHHLAAAAVGVSEEVASTLEAAADLTTERGGVAAGVDALVQAALASPDPHPRARRRLRAAEAAYLGGRRDLARALVTAVVAEDPEDPLSGDGDRCATTTVRLRDQALALDASLRVWSTSADVGEAQAAIEPTIERLAVPAPDLAGLVGVQLTAAMWSAGRTDGARTWIRRVQGFPIVDPAVRHLVDLAHAVITLASGDPSATEDLLRHGWPAAWRDELLQRLPAAYSPLHQLWRWADRVEEGLVEIDAQIDWARRTVATTVLPHSLMLRADIRFEAGDLPRARADLTEAIGLCEDTEQGGLLGYAYAERARIAALEGDESLARAGAELALQTAGRAGLRPVLLFAYHALGLLELGLGRPEEAVRYLEQVRELALALGDHHPKIVPWHADHVEALLGAGRHDEATEVATAFAATADRCRSPWARAVALGALARVTDDDEADGLLVQAVEAQAGMPFEQARTRLFLGEHRRRRGRVRDAREPLALAALTFAELGTLPWARRAEAELRAAGGRVAATTTPALSGLTDRELQICLAVADGGTNKEVGAALFLSRKTVEYHLGHVFRKLGVTSRAQLTRLVADGTG
jgi:DNA-binding CsgD family transcriptional regulator